MKTPHPKADLLRAIADGKQMQKCSMSDGWYDCTDDAAMEAVYLDYIVRIKPRAITITAHGKTFDLPEPLRVAPADGAWLAGISYAEFYRTLMHNHLTGLRFHPTKEAAQAWVDFDLWCRNGGAE